MDISVPLSLSTVSHFGSHVTDSLEEAAPAHGRSYMGLPACWRGHSTPGRAALGFQGLQKSLWPWLKIHRVFS